MTSALEWTPADQSVIVVPDRRKHPCSRCGGPRNVPGQAYCRACHAATMREHRNQKREREAAQVAELARLRNLFHVQESAKRETSEVSA